MLKWVTPHDSAFWGTNVSLPFKDVTPATTDAGHAPAPFARVTATDVPAEIQVDELALHATAPQASMDNIKTTDLIVRR
jgi:hypothetical protein